MTAIESISVEPLKPKAFPKPLAKAIRAAVIERLTLDPLTPHKEIAQELNISHDVVGKIAQKMQGTPEAYAEKRRGSLVRQLRKALPIADRVMAYAQIARGEAKEKAAFSQISALKRIEELEGIVTAKEKKESADNQTPQLPPMFVLPPGTTVKVGAVIQVPDNKDRE